MDADAIARIEEKLSDGSHSFADLTPEEQSLTAQILRPEPGKVFTSDARSLLMNRWLIIPPNRVNEIEQFNTGSMFAVATVQLHEEILIPADLLTGCREGETYAPLRPLLLTAKMRIVDPIVWALPVEDDYAELETQELP